MSVLSSHPQVVITGLGCVSPLGLNMNTSWHALLDGQCGIKSLQGDFCDKLEVSVAGQVLDYDPLQDMDAKTAKRAERFSQMAFSAASQALQDSGLHQNLTDEQKLRFGVSIGVGMGGVEFMFNSSQKFQHRGAKGVSPFLIPQIIPNMAAGIISRQFELRGPHICTASACASGTHGIGEAYMLIKNKMATAMLAGGAESTICNVALAGFANMGALSKSHDPTQASKPFDRHRQGFVMSEGAGVMVLEDLDQALKRKAKIYAQIIGYGMSGDAYHMTQPSPHGDGAARCMKQALDLSGVNPEDVNHLNCHGTSTPLGDLYESEAICDVFGSHTSKLAISATKGATGHLLGGSGGLEACFTALACTHNVVPPTTGWSHADPAIALTLSSQTQSKPIHKALSLSLGFGGTNAAIVFQKYPSA